MANDKQLVSFKDLSTDLEQAVQRDQLNGLLANQPRANWIKRHPHLKVEINGQKQPLEYLPVNIVRTLMRAIFQRTRREILEVKQVAQSIVARVRVHYKDPLTGEWDWQDGVGAVQIQVNQGSSAADLSQIKANAIQLGAPAAVSYAYKNACEEIGNIFGAGIQKERTDLAALLGREGLYNTGEAEPPRQTPTQTNQDEITTNF